MSASLTRRWFAMIVALAVLAFAACTDDGDNGTANGGTADTVDDTTDETIPEEDQLPPLPDEDRSVEIEGGQIVFHGWDVDDVSRQLWTVSSSGGDPTESPVDGYGGVMGPSASPDRTTIVALGWEPDRREIPTTVLVGTPDAGFEPLYEDDDLDMWCVRWYPSGDRVLLTAFVEDEIDPVLLAIDLDGETTELDAPPGRFECAVPLDDDRVALSYIGEGTDFFGIALVDTAAGTSEELHTPEGCFIYGPALSSSGNQIVVSAAACGRPADSGIYVVDVGGGEARQVLAAEIQFPSFSPSDEWIVFTLFPEAESNDGSVWAIKTDGTGLRQIVDTRSTHAIWLAEAGEAREADEADEAQEPVD